MTGFSVYLGQPLDEAYIKRMINLGYQTIFTSIQIPEEDDETKYHYFTQLLNLLQHEQVTYLIDANPSILTPSFYEHLRQYDAQFMIRIDYSTSIETIEAIMAQGFKCCLNASIISRELLTNLHQHLNDFTLLSFCHNYYPRPDTGLSADWVKKKNEYIYQFNKKAQIYGFIVGTDLRGPLHKGLPTIELTRYDHPVVAANVLQDVGITDVLVGDPKIEKRLAIQLIDFCNCRHFSLAINEDFDEQVAFLFDIQHKVRPDNPEKVIRSETSREINSQTIQPHHTVQRHIGSVTVDNLKNGRYQGELQIVRHPLSAHDNVNVVAQIIKEDLSLLNCIAPNDTFNFQKLGSVKSNGK
ncbi:TPA: 6-phospho-N-acetylmuramidase [Staphylococcus argenteus]